MERSRTCHIIVCGIEREVEVDFNIVSYGSADSWLEPGDAPEIEVLRVLDGDRDILDFCNEVRDLWHPCVEAEGFSIWHGGPTVPGRWIATPSHCMIHLNGNRTLLEAIEEDILDNFHEYESDAYDIGGYDD